MSSTTTATKINTKSHFPEESRSDLQEPPLQYCCESPAHAPRPALLSMLPSYPHAHSLVLSPCSGDTPQGLTVDDDDDFPHGDGEEAASAYDSIPLILTSVAGVLQPSDPSQAYVFCGNRYVTIKVIPGTMDDITARGSKVIVDDWPSLLSTQFAGEIDAALPFPNNGKQLYCSRELCCHQRRSRFVIVDRPRGIDHIPADRSP